MNSKIHRGLEELRHVFPSSLVGTLQNTGRSRKDHSALQEAGAEYANVRSSRNPGVGKVFQAACRASSGIDPPKL